MKIDIAGFADRKIPISEVEYGSTFISGSEYFMKINYPNQAVSLAKGVVSNFAAPTRVTPIVLKVVLDTEAE